MVRIKMCSQLLCSVAESDRAEFSQEDVRLNKFLLRFGCFRTRNVAAHVKSFYSTAHPSGNYHLVRDIHVIVQVQRSFTCREYAKCGLTPTDDARLTRLDIKVSDVQ